MDYLFELPPWAHRQKIMSNQMKIYAMNLNAGPEKKMHLVGDILTQ